MISTLAAEYFDGLSTRAVPVLLRIEAGFLHIEDRLPGADASSSILDADARVDQVPAARALNLRVPLADVQWPERARHGARLAHLRAGGTVRGLDAGAWDAWSRASGIRESPIVTAQQSWRGVAIAVMALALLAAAGYLWGVPLIARAALASAPASLDQRIGVAALASLDGGVLLPTEVPLARQREVRDAFEQASARAYPKEDRPAYELQFRTSKRLGTQPGARTAIGPNAFALPGGTIVVTDEMLDLLRGRDDVLTGVLGHELGHVRLRHGMRLLVQASIIGAAGSIAWGDFSTVFAALPVLFGQSAYSRDFERAADAEAIRLLRANRLSPLVMVELFGRLEAKRTAAKNPASADGDDPPFTLGIALASHPADAERIQTFRAAAGL